MKLLFYVAAILKEVLSQFTEWLLRNLLICDLQLL